MANNTVGLHAIERPDGARPGRRRVVYAHDSHGFGGMELYMLRLMGNLDRDRYEPAVLIPGFTDRFRSSSDQFVQMVQQAGVSLVQPPAPLGIAGYSALRDTFDTARLLRMHQVDVVHIHTCRSEGSRKVTLAARLAGVRAVLRTEHFPPGVTMRSISRYVVKPFDWLTNYIVTGSEGDRRDQIELMKRSPEKVYRSYNGVDVERLDPNHSVREAKLRLGLDPDLPVVGTVGRLSVQKGQIYLIEAIAEAIKAHGPVNLLLVGDGELRAELESLAARLNIARYVHFVGFQQDVIPYLRASDIAAMPSLYEVFSLAMLEFMAMGKPVIGSDHSSFREAIVDDVSGLIVPRRDSKGLASAILTLLNDPQLRARLGRAGMERVRTHFTFQRLAEDMMSLYDRVLEQKRIAA
jgi:glycosyltransferase involved in cell wall biosynthesis